MLLRTKIVYVAMMLLSFGSGVAGRDVAPPLALETFDMVWRTIHEHHFDTNYNGVDWQAIREPFRKRVAQAANATEARSVMEEMLDLLKVSHLAIVPSDAAEADEPVGGKEAGGDPTQVQEVDRERSGTAGMEIRFAGEEAIVTRVEKGGPADRAGVQPGWIVRRIGKFEPTRYLRELDTESEKGRFLAWKAASSKLSDSG